MAIAMPAAFQPGGLAARAIASGIENSPARVRTLVLLRPLINRATGLKSALIVRLLELLPVVVRVRQGELAGRSRKRRRRRGGDPNGRGRGLPRGTGPAPRPPPRVRPLAQALPRRGGLLPRPALLLHHVGHPRH